MAISAWMVFCVANVTAGFDMAARDMSLMGMDGDVYFGISVLVFLLSFFMYNPFCKDKRLSIKWTIARIVACMLVLLQTSGVAVGTKRLLEQTSLSPEVVASGFYFMSTAMMVIAVAAVYAILTIDRIAVRRERKLTSIDNGQSSVE